MTTLRKIATVAEFCAIAAAIAAAFCVLLVAVLAVRAWRWVRR